MEWVEVPDDCNYSWMVDNVPGEAGDLIVRPPNFEDDPQMFTAYKVTRAVGYGETGAQLDMMFHHVANGGVIGDANCEWTKHVDAVKTRFPKDDPKACHEQAELFNAEMAVVRAETLITSGEAGQLDVPDDAEAQQDPQVYVFMATKDG
jgi:hypothetical protein